jgi:5'(3')-deoxyribonucleotidase
MPTLRHIFVDLDGVLADFVQSSLALHDRSHLLECWPGGEWDMPKVMGISRGEFWRAISQQGSPFWEMLEPYPWTAELLDQLRSIAPVTIATSPSMDPGCLDGKVRWMQRHLGPSFRDFLIGPQKYLLARPDVVLIDDRDSNVDAFREHGGQAILFPQPWNSNHQLEDRMAYVADQLAK